MILDYEIKYPIDSEAIHKIEYLSDEQRLDVEFEKGFKYKYSYHNVPNDIFEEFNESDSKGAYFNESIRNKYKCTLVGIQ